MKKKILLIILLLVPFMVKANEGFSYKWDIIPSEPKYVFVEEQPEGYTYVKGNALNPGRNDETPQITIYDAKKGTVAKTYTIDAYGEKYRGKESNENVSYAIGENGYFRLYIESEEKSAYIDVQQGTLKLCSAGDTDCTTSNVYELSDADLKKYTGKYYFIFKKHKENPTAYQYGSYDHGIYRIISTDSANIEEANITHDVYLEDGTKVFTVTLPFKDIFRTNYVPTITTNGIYIIKTERDYDNKKISYKLTKYDKSGTKVFTEDITPLVRQTNNISSSNLFAYDVESVDTVEGGLLLKVGYNEAANELGACVAASGVSEGFQSTDGKKMNPRYLDKTTGSKYDNCVSEFLNDVNTTTDFSLSTKSYNRIISKS